MEEEVNMGKLFVIDGTDGSGKQTQFEKLKENLTKRNIKYMTVSLLIDMLLIKKILKSITKMVE